ncbi:3-hydroxyacyl-CoA dehydrogenase NAD-binding domain-containing protein [uncultured Sphingomonas sp.]|uniref:3-hydroxyacyl-CoA dehydrogenase NAD-binding domain-containing protein n=1 Tax=uncultured Sphingomonas sp. TaxID=158754 RepID=UPI0025EC7336|nr:3-hydroxyacyl-CoA dehydrogenase NAD-binding domain-containing protein [uncultured Sphingomonas sp.]
MSTKPFDYAAGPDYAGRTAAIIGGGVIGASWAALFAANGLNVVISDPDPDIETKARTRIVAAMPALVALGHAPFDIAARVRFVDDHAHAVADAFIVQECGPERPGFKQGVWEVVEGAAPAEALLCSSSAGIPASLQQIEMRDHGRLLIAHPINPPHRMPLVEVVPTPTTDPEVTARAVAFYDALGKVTRVIRKEVPGFVANRLQAAIFRECVALVSGGVVTIDELDDIVTTSLGVRLATSGPFLSLHLNGGDGGLPHSIEQLGPPMERLWESLEIATFDPVTRELIARQADQSYGAWPIAQLARTGEAREIAVLNALAGA